MTRTLFGFAGGAYTELDETFEVLLALPEVQLQPGIDPAIGGRRVSALRRLPDALERAAGCLLLVAASPVIVTAAVVISVLSRRSPFVAHLRVGRNSEPFWTLKLRTMWDRPAGGSGEGWVERVVAEPDADGKDAGDPRVTSRFAAFCRRHSIDEFPQFWHVARGQMSLVGPRPLTRTEVLRYYGPHAAELLSRKPGLTGLWQVRGRSEIKFPERAALDLELVRTLTPRKYLAILIQTLPALIYGKGAW
jgi:exopolysaccharide production protein ExoY